MYQQTPYASSIMLPGLSRYTYITSLKWHEVTVPTEYMYAYKGKLEGETT